MAFLPSAVAAHVRKFNATVTQMIQLGGVIRAQLQIAKNPIQNFADDSSPEAGLQDANLAQFGMTRAQYQAKVAAMEAFLQAADAPGPNNGPTLWQILQVGA